MPVEAIFCRYPCIFKKNLTKNGVKLAEIQVFCVIEDRF